LPQENQNFSFIDLKGNVVNSGKAAKFLAEVYFYDFFLREDLLIYGCLSMKTSSIEVF
jgi:hypothetical protein